MRRTLSIAGIVLLILGGLVAFALLNLNRLVNQNKEFLLTRAEEQLGRPVSVEEIGLTLWGGIGVRLENAVVADDPAFSPEAFLRIPALRVNVEFLPLLRRELKVSQLVLQDPVMTVIRNQTGEFNFTSLGPAEGEPEGQPGAAEEAEEASPPAAAAALPWLVSRVVIADGDVRYVDRGNGTELQVSQVDLSAENVGGDQPVALRLAAAVLGAERQNVELQGQIGPLGATPTMGTTPLTGNISIDPLNLDAAEQLPPIRALLPADVDVTGPLAVNTRVEGTLENFSVNGTVNATASALQVGEQFRKPAGVTAVFSTDARVTDQLIALQKAQLTVHTVELTGTGQINRGEVPVLDLTVDSNRTEIGEWKQFVPPLQDYDIAGQLALHTRLEGKVQDGALPHVRGSLTVTAGSAALPALPRPLTDIDAQVSFTENQAELGETTARLGGSPIRLSSVQVQQWTPLRLTYQLAAPELWLADVGVADADGAQRNVLREVKNEGQLWSKNGNISYQGQASSTQGIVSGAAYTNLRTAVALAGQVISLTSLTVQVFDGTVQGSGQYNFGAASPRLALTSQVRGVDLSRVFQTLRPSAAQLLQGRLQGDVQLAGTGENWEQLRQTLQGQGQVEVHEGMLRDINIAEQILSAVTGVPGLSLLISPQVREKYPEIFATNNTEFTQLRGAATVDGGRAQVADLVMEAADWAMQGKGEIALDGELDIRALLILSQRLSQDMVGSVKEVRYILNQQQRMEIPFALTGTLPQIKPRPDLDYVGRLLQRAAIRRGAEEVQKRVLEKILPQEEQPAEQEGEAFRPERRDKEQPEELLRKGIEKGLEQLLGR